MKIIKIDNRLKDIASLVDKCDIVADIGTDHGYLPIYLIQKGICNKAIAADVAINPLNSAKENINYYQLDDKIITKLTNGLINIEKVNFVIIAGMGGNLIVDILSNQTNIHDNYILQPNLHVDLVRKYLSENGYMIIDEKVSYAHKKYYEILKVCKGNQKLTEKEIKYGPINLSNKSDLFIKKWTEILNKYEIILNDFKGSNDEKEKIIDKINELKEILN